MKLRSAWGLLPFTLAWAAVGCNSDYEGERYPRVAEAADIVVVDVVPEGYRVIGTVSGSCESSRSDNDDLIDVLADPPCTVEKVVNKMARKAAKNGGELLVHLDCERYEEVSDEWEEVDDDYEYVTTVSDSIDCTADVARAWSRDE